MLYALFIANAIISLVLLALSLIGGIKLYKQVDRWFDNQQTLGQKELNQAFHNGHISGAIEQKNRIGKILKDEYNKQDNQETIKTIIKINKLIKQEEEN